MASWNFISFHKNHILHVNHVPYNPYSCPIDQLNERDDAEAEEETLEINSIGPMLTLLSISGTQSTSIV